MMGRVKNWIGETWGVVKAPSSVAALIYSILAFGGGQIIAHYQNAHDQYQRQVEARVLSFIDSTREFDALAASLANGIMDKNAPDLEDRNKLIANLNRQFTEVDDLRPLVKDHPELVAAYKNSIEKLNQQLPQVNSVRSMKSFWEAMSDVLGTRRKLDQELMQSSHMALD